MCGAGRRSGRAGGAHRSAPKQGADCQAGDGQLRPRPSHCARILRYNCMIDERGTACWSAWLPGQRSRLVIPKPPTTDCLVRKGTGRRRVLASLLTAPGLISCGTQERLISIASWKREIRVSTVSGATDATVSNSSIGTANLIYASMRNFSQSIP